MAIITNVLNQDNSLQLSRWGVIDISTEDFELISSTGTVYNFLIKNESDNNVTLSVVPASSSDDVALNTVFYPGWNVELVKKVEVDALITADLKYGR